jgi:hypothetical protein
MVPLIPIAILGVGVGFGIYSFFSDGSSERREECGACIIWERNILRGLVTREQHEFWCPYYPENRQRRW